MKICFETKIAGFPITLTQAEDRRKRFTVIYGKQRKGDLRYGEACKELGECIMHALACQGSLDNTGDL